MQTLKEAIAKRGQIVNFIVRPIAKGRWEIINGNHRLDAMIDSPYQEAMCCDVGTVSEAEAEMIALETNEIRFDVDEIQLSKVLKHINQEIPVEEMTRTLPFDVTTVENHIRMLDFDFDQYNNKENEENSPEQPNDEAFKTLNISLPESVYNQFQEQLIRFKLALYPDKDPEQVANVTPVEAMMQLCAQCPDDQLI